ncbi:ATP-binding cassette domain-containing protein [bacterium]|nr:ATP-binding cassette domain-containing protein [bacterium]
MIKRLLSSFRTHLSRIVWAVKQVWHAGPMHLSGDVALSLCIAVLPAVLLYLIKRIFDTVSELSGSGQLDSAEAGGLLFRVAGVAAIALAIVLLRFVQQIVREELSQRTQDRIQERIHQASSGIDLIQYETPDYHNRFYLAQQQGVYRPRAIVQELTTLVQQTFSLAAMAGVLATFSPYITLLLLAAILPGVAARFYVSRDLADWEKRRSETTRKTSYIHHLLTWHRFAPDIRAFQLGEYLGKLHRDFRAVLRRETIGIIKRRAVTDIIVQIGGIAVVFSAFAWITMRVVRGAATVGDLVLFYSAFQRLLQSLQQLFSTLAELYESSLFIHHLQDFLSLKTKADSGQKPARAEALHAEPPTLVELKAVSFRYPGAAKPVLRNIDLSFERGERIALIGENGSGKSTLAKIIAGFYEPTDGICRRQPNMRVGEKEKDLRIAYLSQDYSRLYFSLGDNIEFGCLDARGDRDRMEEAARNSGVDCIAHDLEDGYDTILGKLFGNGIELSEGQWQRVALARSDFRDGSVLILDEPTSAMDTRAAYRFNRYLADLPKEKSIILITHRVINLQWMDRLYFLEDGHIVEAGSWDELKERGGRLSELLKIYEEEGSRS